MSKYGENRILGSVERNVNCTASIKTDGGLKGSSEMEAYTWVMHSKSMMLQRISSRPYALPTNFQPRVISNDQCT